MKKILRTERVPARTHKPLWVRATFRNIIIFLLLYKLNQDDLFLFFFEKNSFSSLLLKSCVDNDMEIYKYIAYRLDSRMFFEILEEIPDLLYQAIYAEQGVSHSLYFVLFQTFKLLRSSSNQTQPFFYI